MPSHGSRVWTLALAASTLVLLPCLSAGASPALAQAACGTSSLCGASQHTISFQNNCDYPVWVANASNVVGGSVVGGKACSAPGDCCVTLADGTQDCTGVNCVNGYCSQINCTKNSDCPSSSSGLTACNVPKGVQCASDNDCATYSCTSNSDCPPSATCTNNVCTGMCQSSVCACKSGTACPGAGTTCDLAANSNFGFCAGGACQYNGLLPKSASGQTQWQLAASCASDGQCAAGRKCQKAAGSATGQCTCQSAADCAGVGGTCSNGVCSGQSATICMPSGWGGRIWGRTGCSTVNGAFQCQTGQCGQGAAAVQACTSLAQGVSQTATGVTLFEGTWDSNQTDFWDVSLVNGYNLPMAVGACASAKKAASCTFAGQSVTAANVGCTSDLMGSCPTLLAIPGQCNCVTNSDCPSGQTCGANNLCSGTGSCTVACLDPGDLCKGFGLFGGANAVTAPACLRCNDQVASTNSSTYNDFYNCVGPLATLSCNNAAYVCFSDADCPYAGQTCQGNVCWPVNALDDLANCVQGACSSKVNQVAQYSCQTVQGKQLCLPQAPTATRQGCCGPYNSSWTTAMQAAAGTVDAGSTGSCKPGTQAYTAAFKAACPTAYSYQFDDPSSSYQCSDANGEVNYLVTFCPSGTAAAVRRK
jgi:hypothetical protein